MGVTKHGPWGVTMLCSSEGWCFRAQRSRGHQELIGCRLLMLYVERWTASEGSVFLEYEQHFLWSK